MNKIKILITNSEDKEINRDFDLVANIDFISEKIILDQISHLIKKFKLNNKHK